ncbi:hypothetical protein BU25DRAFT_82689 [Macroventuria anomochaeta]|uniref:Uncharacterized protein n=1 Tax=Macroventuria anomochaeta TaxID=301207 RepID=A0ACB6SFM9_9PLEO|nr:uncharacterized protein BU25DRAFT_82689 [Macroventuria anomochaeta]KAF2632793.1 hypothetical protein BU25DRAFT_82689 [Macroventuria anomochaeta]
MSNQTSTDAGDSSSLLITKVESSGNPINAHSYQQIPNNTTEHSAGQASQHGASSFNPSEPDKPHLISHQKDFFLDWTLKILGVACAILFGIWAPISFKLASDGNKENDASQKAVFSQLGDMRQQAATAAQMQNAAATAMANVQFAAANVMAEVQHQLDRMGKLRAWEFCEGRAEQIRYCRELSSSGDVGTLVYQLGGLGPTKSLSITTSSVIPVASISNSVPVSQSNEPSAGSSGAGVPKDVLAVVLGSVFSVIVVVGLVVGLLARRRRWKKMNEGVS